MRNLKLFILSLAAILFVSGTIYAKTQDNEITLNNTTYTLKYSTNKTQSGEYMNEYYKQNEKGYDWTELITVSEFPNYPNKTMDYAESILSRDNSPNNFDRPLASNSRTEKVTFVFLLAGKTDEYKYIELNIMQALPYKNYKGLKTLLYSKKYKYTTKEEYVSAYNQIESDKQKYFNIIKEMEIPAVVHKDIE